MVTLNPEIISEALYSGVLMLGKEKLKKKDVAELPRAILIDMQVVSYLEITNNGTVKDSDLTQQKLKEVVQSRLEDTEIEFIYYDEITQSILAFTSDYISKLEKGEIKIISLVMSYFKIWYIKKCGAGRNKTEGHNNIFKTFSKTEVEYLKRELIPIATVPTSLTAVHNAIEYAIQVSPLEPHVTRDNGFNVKGNRIEGSITWWINFPIAKIYLGVDSDLEVLSETMLEKLIEDAGFSDMPAQLDIKELEIDLSELNLNTVDDLLAKKYGYTEDNQRQSEVQRIISTNALADDGLKKEETENNNEPREQPTNAFADISLDWH